MHMSFGGWVGIEGVWGLGPLKFPKIPGIFLQPFSGCATSLLSVPRPNGISSMVVFGSPKRWDGWHIINPPIGSIYRLYTTYIYIYREPETTIDQWWIEIWWVL